MKNREMTREGKLEHIERRRSRKYRQRRNKEKGELRYKTGKRGKAMQEGIKENTKKRNKRRDNYGDLLKRQKEETMKRREREGQTQTKKTDERGGRKRMKTNKGYMITRQTGCPKRKLGHGRGTAAENGRKT